MSVTHVSSRSRVQQRVEAQAAAWAFALHGGSAAQLFRKGLVVCQAVNLEKDSQSEGAKCQEKNEI